MRRDLRHGLLAFLLVAATASAGSTDKFAVGYPLAADGDGTIHVASLPEGAYAWTRPGANLGDVIVVDAEGKQVPSAPYVPLWAVKRQVQLSLVLLAVPPTDPGTLPPRIERTTTGELLIQRGDTAKAGTPREWLVDAHNAIRPDGFAFPPVLVAPGGDVQLANVSIETSNDLQLWTTVAPQVTVTSAALAKDRDGRSRVDVTGAAGRYFRVRIVSGDVVWAGDSPGVTISGQIEPKVKPSDVKRQWRDVAPTSSAANGQGVDYDYVLPAALPIDALRLTRGSDSVERLEAMTLTGDHTAESLGTLVVAGDQGDATTTLTVQRARRAAIRLHSATPLRDPPKLSLGWVPDRFAFLTDGHGPYRLLLGSALARRPNWPVDDALVRVRARQPEGWEPPEATVGAEDRVDGASAIEGPDAPFDWTRLVLWVVLGVGVVLVGGMAMSLLRRPPPPREGP
ncbi:MAG: DUF3999 family protein [Luteibacter sp.]